MRAARTECNWSARLLEAEVLLRSDQQDAAAAALSSGATRTSRVCSPRRETYLAPRRLGIRARAPRSFRSAFDQSREDGIFGRSLGCRFRCQALSLARLLFVYRHDADQAETIFRKVAEQADRRRDAYHEAVALNGIGMMRLKDWRFDEAIPWFQKTTEAAKRGGVQRLIVAAGQNLAICYSQLGSFEEAIKSRQTGHRPFRRERIGALSHESGLGDGKHLPRRRRYPRKPLSFTGRLLPLAVT